MYDNPKSKINQLEKVLDSREDRVSKKVKRHELHDHESSVPENWDDSEFEDKALSVGLEVNTNPNFVGTNISMPDNSKKNMAFSLKVLIGSIIFFFIALGVVLLNFMFGGNIVSGDNIEVTVKAPVSIAGGESLTLEIEIKNNNNVSLIGADLNIIFPAGAMQFDNIGVPVKREQIFIGDIAPGRSAVKNIKIVLFGSENEKKNIDLTLEYKVSGSNSLFNKTKSIPVLVTSAPVSLVVTSPTEINANQSVTFNVDVVSNSNSVIKNLLLKVDYPFGFTFSNSSPATFYKNNFWFIGDLAPGEKRAIKFTGNVSGQEGEERGFNFNLGTQSPSETVSIENPFTSSFSSVTIRRPFVSADIEFDGVDTKEYTTGAGDKVEAVIKWRNNLSYQVTNVALAVKLDGNALDKSSVEVDGGFYRSIDNTIIFDKTTSSSLGSLDPGESGESKFSFKSFSASSVTGSGLTNPVISLAINVQGRTVEMGGDSKNVTFSDSRKVKITSNPRLFAKSLHYVGPFQNTGPIPPKAEKETTYTITWNVINPLNNLSGARVTAILPPYIKWLDIVSPSSEKMSYDANTRQISWSLGNISAGAGIVSPAREVSFQISLLPSVSQIGTVPDLITQSTLSARDVFTGTNVSSIFQAVNTSLNGDPYFTDELEKVVK